MNVSVITKLMNLCEKCNKCNSQEIDIVNSFSKEVTIECRDCKHVKLIYKDLNEGN